MDMRMMRFNKKITRFETRIDDRRSLRKLAHATLGHPVDDASALIRMNLLTRALATLSAKGNGQARRSTVAALWAESGCLCAGSVGPGGWISREDPIRLHAHEI